MTRRTARLGEEIREEVAGLLARGLKDPRVGFVTVTRVDVTEDLHQARVHVSVLGDEQQRRASLQGLRQAAGWLRRELGRRLRVRYTPELLFVYDPGIEATERVARLLDQAVHVEHDTDAAEGEARSEHRGEDGASDTSDES